MDQEPWDTTQAQRQESTTSSRLLRPRGYCGCHRAQRASHHAHAQLLTLIPLRISFMIFKRLSLFFIFLTCQERITDRTSIHVSGSRFASDATSQWYLQLLLGENLRYPVMGTLSSLLSLLLPHSPPFWAWTVLAWLCPPPRFYPSLPPSPSGSRVQLNVSSSEAFPDPMT